MSVNTDDIQIPIDPSQEVQEQPPVSQNSKIFTEDEVNKIRQQEKDKLYSRLEDAQSRMKMMEEQLNSLAADRESAVKEAEERAAKEAELIRQRELEELSAKELLTRKEDEFNQKINKVEEEWSNKFQQLEQQRLAQEALLEKERELQYLETYRQRRIAEEQENIIPELIDLISGTTQEDIETSISALRDRSSAIIESIQQASQAQAPRLKGAPVTAPPTGPLENQSEYQTLTADDIRNMPMDQYEKMRDRLLQARSPRGRF